MMDYIKGIYGMMFRLINEKPDVVIASSTYPLDNYPVYKLAKKSNAKYVYEVHDLWPLSPMELGGYSKYHPFILLMQHAEDFAYKHVDKVVSILPCAKQHMVDHGLKEDKFVHIPNGIFLDEKTNIEYLNEDIQCCIPSDKFIVAYTGNLGLGNAVDALLKSAVILKNEYPCIFFIIIGKGPEKENIIKLKNELELNNLIIMDSISKRQIQNLLVKIDIVYIGLQKQSLFRFGISPNKLFDYMYAGKPVVQAIEAGNNIVADSNCGITVEPENPQSIADGILKLYNMSKAERQLIGENGRRYVIENHAYEGLAKDFLSIMSP
jgi:glycosyltransferase involved in cell wall biosynthesis